MVSVLRFLHEYGVIFNSLCTLVMHLKELKCQVYSYKVIEEI
jgi:hypothetical protein